MAVDRDRIQEANEAINRRAAQRHAASRAAIEAQTPEAIAAEEERQRIAALGESITEDVPAVYDPAEPNMNLGLSEKLAEALQPVLDAEPEPDIIGIGRCVFQWILVPSDDEDNPGGYQLGMQLQVDEQPPGGFVAEITPALLESWMQGKGLQKNRTEHKRFAAGLIERAIEIGALETGNALIYTLEQLMLQDPLADEDYVGEIASRPTATAVGEDESE